jgi:acetoin utilization deacetylase AcuC-like enzyme
MQVVAARWARAGGHVRAPREATDDDLVRVHQPAYIDAITATRGRAVMLDPDTFTSPETEEIARLAAGAVVVAVEEVLSGAGRRALVLVRPPGHHAEPDRAMGFCLYNNVAVAAAAARASGLSRVAIVDYDVHHGNGTQTMFYADPSVLFVSSHQYPYYPGTGPASDIGRGEGRGYTVNFPMEVGATDADYDLVYREAVIPLLEQYRPEVVLISAGFDAHERDPLGGMRMTSAGYGQLTARLIAAADKLCAGRIVFVTEGGYDTSALAECCQGVIDLAAADSLPAIRDLSGETTRGEQTLDAFRQAHRR